MNPVAPARVQSCVALERPTYLVNPEGGRLYAVLHPAAGSVAPDVGVVFCHPLAEEKHASYRALVDFARFLAQRGIPSIRFDCFGFGESGGEMIDVTIDSQIADVCAAVSGLKAEFDVGSVVLIGLRFGATIARLVAESDERISSLVLIAPVVLGADYWAGMLKAQQLSCLARRIKVPKVEELQRAMAEDGHLEIKAERFSGRFCEQIWAVNLLRSAERFGGRQLIAAAGEHGRSYSAIASLAAACAASGSEVTTLFDGVGQFWTVKSLYSGYRPVALYEHTDRWLKALSP